MSEHKLIHGDCLVAMAGMEDNSTDAIIADPPYGTTACKWDTVISLEQMWIQLKRIIKDNGPIVLFGSEPFSSHLRLSNIKWYKYDWVWDKVKPSGFQVAKYKPMIQHENIMVFGKNRVNYYPIMTDRDAIKKSTAYTKSSSNPVVQLDLKMRVYDKKYPKSIQTFSNANQRNKLHSTQKPISLMEYLIRTYTNEGDTVLDFTMGSGTTGVACMNTNRNFIGVELEKEYFEIAQKRIEEAAKEPRQMELA